MSSRLIALALALLLLLTQQLGLQHLLSHGLTTAALAAVAGASAQITHPAAHPAAGDAAATDATDATADGRCLACLALLVLGTATLPALLRWAARVLRTAAPGAPVVRTVRRGAGAPYLARAPPLRA